MSFQKKIVYVILLTGIVSSTTFSQGNTVSGGSAGSGTRGNSSFAIGQVFHFTLTNKTTSNSKEVQKALKESTLKNENRSDFLLDVTLFPNPTTANVVLKINNVPIQEFDFLLYDLVGRFIMKQKVTNKETIIRMDQLVDAIYVLKINRNNREVQTFKIIKKQ